MTDTQRYPDDMSVPEIVEEYARLHAQVKDAKDLLFRIGRVNNYTGKVTREFKDVLGEQEVRVDEGYHSYVNRIEEMLRDGEDVPEGLRWAAVDRLLDDDYYGRYLDDVQEWPEEPAPEEKSKRTIEEQMAELLKGLK